MRQSNHTGNCEHGAETSRAVACPPDGREVILCRDAERINAVANHPEIRPFIGPGDALDMSEAVSRPENWFLMGEHGGFALIWSAPKVYEVHTFIKRSGRGRWAYKAAADMIAFATDSGAAMLWTRIHPEHRPTISFARHFGMRPVGYSVETFGQPYGIYKMELR